MPQSPKYCLEILHTALKQNGLPKTYEISNTTVWNVENDPGSSRRTLVFTHTIVSGILNRQWLCVELYGFALQPPTVGTAGPLVPSTALPRKLRFVHSAASSLI